MAEKATTSSADIVIYGGSFSAAAAAIKAAKEAPTKKIEVIIPYPVANESYAFGSIGTVGGQNFFDVRGWNGKAPTAVIGGTFAELYKQYGQFYGTKTMASRLRTLVTANSNVTVRYGYDIEKINSGNDASNTYIINNVTIRKLSRNSSGVVTWGATSTEIVVTGKVFIDASDDGRLARLVNSAVTVGRYDWPAIRLDSSERGDKGVAGGNARQQAATLMFKVKGVNFNASGDMFWETASTGVKACYGGRETYKNNATIKSFNNTYRGQGYALKPINAAQDGAGSNEWWVNALLVFNVDGRAYNRDKTGGTGFFPSDMRSDYKTVDDAWVAARNFLKNTPAFLTALRQFTGFSNVSLVTDTSGNPIVGEVLYLRETVHMAMDSQARGNGTEDTNYQLTAVACNKAGSPSAPGSDEAYKSRNIGLNFYGSDINAYQASDLTSTSGVYIWNEEIGQKLRPDLGITSATPINPVYVPFQTLLTGYVANLLIAGYASGIASFGWAECRVIPNLCVLGDAAGVTAAYAVNNDKRPQQFTTTDIGNVRSRLRANSAILDK